MRVPISRRDPDGTMIDGTARCVPLDGGGWALDDFVDLEGQPLDLPVGSEYVLPINVDEL